MMLRILLSAAGLIYLNDPCAVGQIAVIVTDKPSCGRSAVAWIPQ